MSCPRLRRGGTVRSASGGPACRAERPSPPGCSPGPAARPRSRGPASSSRPRRPSRPRPRAGAGSVPRGSGSVPQNASSPRLRRPNSPRLRPRPSSADSGNSSNTRSRRSRSGMRPPLRCGASPRPGGSPRPARARSAAVAPVRSPPVRTVLVGAPPPGTAPPAAAAFFRFGLDGAGNDPAPAGPSLAIRIRGFPGRAGRARPQTRAPKAALSRHSTGCRPGPPAPAPRARARHPGQLTQAPPAHAQRRPGPQHRAARRHARKHPASWPGRHWPTTSGVPARSAGRHGATPGGIPARRPGRHQPTTRGIPSAWLRRSGAAPGSIPAPGFGRPGTAGGRGRTSGRGSAPAVRPRAAAGPRREPAGPGWPGTRTGPDAPLPPGPAGRPGPGSAPGYPRPVARPGPGPAGRAAPASGYPRPVMPPTPGPPASRRAACALHGWVSLTSRTAGARTAGTRRAARARVRVSAAGPVSATGPGRCAPEVSRRLGPSTVALAFGIEVSVGGSAGWLAPGARPVRALVLGRGPLVAAGQLVAGGRGRGRAGSRGPGGPPSGCPACAGPGARPGRRDTARRQQAAGRRDIQHRSRGKHATAADIAARASLRRSWSPILVLARSCQTGKSPHHGAWTRRPPPDPTCSSGLATAARPSRPARHGRSRSPATPHQPAHAARRQPGQPHPSPAHNGETFTNFRHATGFGRLQTVGRRQRPAKRARAVTLWVAGDHKVTALFAPPALDWPRGSADDISILTTVYNVRKWPRVSRAHGLVPRHHHGQGGS